MVAAVPYSFDILPAQGLGSRGRTSDLVCVFSGGNLADAEPTPCAGWTFATVDPGCTCPCGYCTGQVAGGHEKCPYRCGRKRMEATTSHPTGAGPGRPVPSFRPHPAAKLGASVPAGALSGGGA